MPKWIAQKWHKYTIALFLSSLIYLFFVFFESKELGCLGLLFFLFLFVIHERLSRWLGKAFSQIIHTVQERIEHQGVQALERMPIGVLITNQDDTIEWYNSFVQNVIGKKSLLGKKLKDVFPDSMDSDLELNGRVYRLIKQDEHLYLIHDVSELIELKKKLHDEQVVFGFLHIDNIDEASHGLSEQDYTLLLSQVVGLITQWAQEYHMTIKRLDTDKFVFITEQRSLERLLKTRFEILDRVRGLTGNHRIPITLSMGLSSTGNNMMERSQNAQAALDIALARGGDQVAIRDGDRLTFIGGKTNAVEKRTRVRARVISQSLANLFRDYSFCIIMGHKLPDLDAIGSAIGIARFAMIYECDPYIILDETNNPSIEKLIKELAKNKFWRSRLITPDKAFQKFDISDSLLVVVDTHKPSLAIEPGLLEEAQTVVVIDHHRRGEDIIEDAVITYLEPYASSTSELVTELLQYQEQQLTMETIEATALLAGIVVDTNNFTIRAGSRTFEAASFLRRHGADLVLLQSFLKEDLHSYMKRAEMIRNTEVLFGTYAIATGEETETYDQLLIAQTADTLVNMQGISASFVIARRDDGLIGISARSHGEVNVQLIMEQLGGGGHLTNAACQLKNISVEEAKRSLVALLEQMIESEGENE